MLDQHGIMSADRPIGLHRSHSHDNQYSLRSFPGHSQLFKIFALSELIAKVWLSGIWLDSRRAFVTGQVLDVGLV
jgi:hypothetical protein